MPPIIEVERLSKVYRIGSQDVHAVDDVSLTIEQGEYVALMGPSGSGKSTLMHLLGCLDSPTGGRYRLAGQEVANLSEDQRAEIRNRRIGFVFQSFNLLPRATALHNVELPLLYGRWDNRRQRALRALGQVGLAGRAAHRPQEMSGGEQQRLAVARALVTEPDILLADEPTGNLDTRTGLELLRLLQQLHDRGATLIVVTHDPRVGRFAHRLIHLLDGHLISDQRHTPEPLPAAPAAPEGGDGQ